MYYLLPREFKIIIIKILAEIRRTMQEQNENFSKKKFTEIMYLKNTSPFQSHLSLC